MPRSSCEPCCNPGELSRHLPMYRDAMLQILCAILAAEEAQSGTSENLVQNQVTLTTSTAETPLLAAGAAGVYHDLSSVVVTNTSATPSLISFRDALGGTVRFSIYIPATSSKELSFNPRWLQTTAASAWTVQSSASVTSILISAQAINRGP